MRTPKRIDYAFHKYYFERSKEKHAQIINHYQKYLDNLCLSENISYSLSEVEVDEVIYAYYLDVIKYKESHFSSDIGYPSENDNYLDSIHNKFINNDKVASLSAKWLLKHQIISFNVEGSYNPTCDESTLMYSANTCCVLSYICTILELPETALEGGDTIWDDLLYHFQYRNYDERHFFLINKLLRKLYN